MSTPISPRHDTSVKQKVPIGKVPVGKKQAHEEEETMVAMSASAGKLFTFTIDANTAQVVKLETLDASGARHELSEEEKASLAKATNGGDLREFVEKAFEAGIACVLGEDQHQQKADEPADEAELRHLLLTPLIEH